MSKWISLKRILNIKLEKIHASGILHYLENLFILDDPGDKVEVLVQIHDLVFQSLVVQLDLMVVEGDLLLNVFELGEKLVTLSSLTLAALGALGIATSF